MGRLKIFVAVLLAVATVVAVVSIMLPSLSCARTAAKRGSVTYSMPQDEADRLRSLGYVSQGPPARTPYTAQRASGNSPGLTVQDYDGDGVSDVTMPAFQPGEELWIIQQPVAADRDGLEDVPGCGALLAKLSGADEDIPVPLKHTDVQAYISGYIATVDVTQQYHNPYDAKIEAKYVFPLPQNAAVNEFIMTIGERRIRGIIREREEAEQIYEQARSQGYVASLLTQERPNIFTQSVANIEPGKEIDINIKYFHTLAYVDGWYEYVFPMVVGPRFNPPGTADGVGAVPRGAGGSSGQATEVRYLKPNERSGHDIVVTVTIDAGVEVEQIESVNHVIARADVEPGLARVRLGDEDTIPNKDFVLRYRVAGESVKSGLVTYRDKRGGFFTLMLYPPADLADVERNPVELVFVLDCSGSMSGEPMAQSKAAMQHALKCMRTDDTFQIIRFSSNASKLGNKPLAATPKNVKRGLKYVRKLSGGGGTMMIEGVKAALDFPHDPSRLRYVVFLTDGYIGNEDQILAAVYEKLGAARVFSFGVGSSPNRYLLNRMAQLGRGTVAYLSLNDDGAAVMDTFFQRISHAPLRDVCIDWGGLDVSEVYPQRPGDLYVGRPIIVTGRLSDPRPTTIRVTGVAGGATREIEVPLAFDDSETHAGLPAVWARLKIKDLHNRSLYDPDIELPQVIREVALEYSLMSAYTAFVAVDSLTQTAGDFGTTVPIPVPVPDGVRYETTVTETP